MSSRDFEPESGGNASGVRRGSGGGNVRVVGRYGKDRQ